MPSAFIDGSLLFIEPMDGVVDVELLGEEVEPLGEVVVPMEPLVPGELVELGVSLVDGLVDEGGVVVVVDEGGVVTVDGVVVVEVALGALAASLGPELLVLWAHARPPAMAKATAAAADRGFRFPLMSVLLVR